MKQDFGRVVSSTLDLMAFVFPFSVIRVAGYRVFWQWVQEWVKHKDDNTSDQLIKVTTLMERLTKLCAFRFLPMSLALIYAPHD